MFGAIRWSHFCVRCFPEQLISPEQFAEILCADMDLNPIHFVQAIAAAIRQQIEAFPAVPTEETVQQFDQRIILKVLASQYCMKCHRTV